MLSMTVYMIMGMENGGGSGGGDMMMGAIAVIVKVSLLLNLFSVTAGLWQQER